MYVDQDTLTITELLWAYGLFALVWLLYETTK